MVHHPHTTRPRGPRPPRSLVRRLATYLLRGFTVSVGATLVLAIVVSRMLTSSGQSHRGASPTSTAVESKPAHTRAGDPAGGHSPVGTAANPDPPRGTPVSVSVATRPAGPAVPADFLGLSFEVRSLPAIAGYATRGNLVALMRSLGPGVMRFGGISADEQATWVGDGSPRPGWARVAITEADLAGLATLARETGWRVLLTVNLGHYDPSAAAREAAAAHRLLGSSLEGIEIGNEPDLLVRKHLRGPGWGIVAYGPQARSYRAAIAAAAPGTSIAGPDPSTGVGGLGWLRTVASSASLRPALLTDHYYPLSSCGGEPTASELLSPNVRRAESDMLGKALAIAHAHGLALRMDETNNVSCEGEHGVSDAFVSALWALDYAARAASEGVGGLNFHDLIDKSDAYSPLVAHSPAALGAGALRAAPEWYALLAARAFLGARPPAHPPDRPLESTVTGAAPGELSAEALRAADGSVQVALVDYAPRAPPRSPCTCACPAASRGGASCASPPPPPAPPRGCAWAGVRSPPTAPGARRRRCPG